MADLSPAGPGLRTAQFPGRRLSEALLPPELAPRAQLRLSAISRWNAPMTVLRETFRSHARLRVAGMRVPGDSRPSCTRSRICSEIWTWRLTVERSSICIGSCMAIYLQWKAPSAAPRMPVERRRWRSGQGGSP